MMNPRIAPLEPPYAPDLEASLAKWMPPGSGMPPLALFRTLAVHPMLFARMRPLGAGLLGHGTLPARIRELLILRTSARCGARYEWSVHVTAYARAAGLDEAQIRATAMAPAGAFGWGVGASEPVHDPRARRGDERRNASEAGLDDAGRSAWAAAETSAGELGFDDADRSASGATKTGPHDVGFDDADRLALSAADELHDRATLSDEVFAAARARFGDAGVLEIAAVAGFYHLIAFVIGTARVALEPWAAAFPQVAP